VKRTKKCKLCIHLPGTRKKREYSGSCDLCHNYDSYTEEWEVTPDDYTRDTGCLSKKPTLIANNHYKKKSRARIYE